MGGTSSSSRSDYNNSNFKNSPNDINVLITNSGPKAISEASNTLKKTIWANTLKDGRNLADQSGHDCAPGRSGNSKDQDTVDDLRQYTNGEKTGKTDVLQIKARGFKENVNNGNGNFQKEVKRVKDFIKNYDNDTYSRNFDANRNRTEVRQNLKNIRDKRISEYNTQIQKLNDEIKELVRLQGLVSMLSSDANSNINDLNNYKYALNKNIELNKKELTYLNNKIGTARNIGINNYEELYKAVILQNELLDNALNETSNKIVQFNREADLISNKKELANLAYFYLIIIYFIAFIVLFIFLFFYEKVWSFYFRIFILILFLLYPFYIYTLEVFVYNCWNYLLSILSGSVFTYTNRLM